MSDLMRPNSLHTRRKAVQIIADRASPPTLTPEAIACRDSLAAFFRASWHVLEQSTELVWNWHLQAMCDHVQALLEGKLAKRNLLSNVPPGSAKSRIVSVAAPAWMWIRKPTWRAIFASGNPRVATRDSIYCRQLIESPWYRRTFGIRWTLADDQNAKLMYSNSTGGFRQALTAGQRTTGDRADSLFVDDPLDAVDAYSESALDSIIEWWGQAFANRLSDLRTGTRAIIMQRLHEKDLAGHVLARERDHWELLRIPMLWEESQRITTSIGWTDPRTMDGALMFPERFPADVIDLERLRLGSAGFAGQHQQRPASVTGEIFKVGKFGWYKPSDPLPAFQMRCQSWDTAFKAKQESDYSVGFELAKTDRHIFVLDRARGQFPYPELKEWISRWGAKSRPNAVLIEDAASGQSVIQELKATTSLPITPMRPDGDKTSRAHSVVPTYESGVILLPEGAPWVSEFLAELHAFPRAAHDDQVDSFVQGIRWLIQPRTQIRWTNEFRSYFAR
jgi:predicted phage terminase large subunit-like protein